MAFFSLWVGLKRACLICDDLPFATGGFRSCDTGKGLLTLAGKLRILDYQTNSHDWLSAFSESRRLLILLHAYLS